MLVCQDIVIHLVRTLLFRNSDLVLVTNNDSITQDFCTNGIIVFLEA